MTQHISFKVMADGFEAADRKRATYALDQANEITELKLTISKIRRLAKMADLELGMAFAGEPERTPLVPIRALLRAICKDGNR